MKVDDQVNASVAYFAGARRETSTDCEAIGGRDQHAGDEGDARRRAADGRDQQRAASSGTAMSAMRRGELALDRHPAGAGRRRSRRPVALPIAFTAEQHAAQRRASRANVAVGRDSHLEHAEARREAERRDEEQQQARLGERAQHVALARPARA